MTHQYHTVPETSVQELKFFELRKSQKATPSVTFLCVFTGQEMLLEDSLNSIGDIAEEMGLEYEIMVVNTTLIPINPLSTEGVRPSNRLQIAHFTYFTAGEAKNEAIKACTGTHVVIFDPEKEYDINYADTILQFVKQREIAIFYGEFLIIVRDIIDSNGGWRPLSVAEDLDLLSRISETNKIMFYPTEGKETINRFLTYKPSQIASKRSYRSLSFRKKLRIMEDLITGSNYRHGDIAYFWKGRFRLIGELAYMRIKLSRKVKRDSGKSNFTIMMEALFESVILNEFEKYEIPGKPMRLYLEPDDIKYLQKKSDVFGKIKKTILGMFEKKD